MSFLLVSSSTSPGQRPSAADATYADGQVEVDGMHILHGITHLRRLTADTAPPSSGTGHHPQRARAMVAPIAAAPKCHEGSTYDEDITLYRDREPARLKKVLRLENLASMTKLARAATEQMPPESRFWAEDAAVVQKHRDLLLSYGPDLVAAFYRVVYDHSATADVFTEGERPEREAALANWWRRTVSGPVDDSYFAWMAMVGLVHVIRKVNNPMMLAMSGFVCEFVADRVAASDLAPAERRELVTAFRRLSTTVASIITFSYDQVVVPALFDVVGMPEPLLLRLLDQEAARALSVARQEIATG